MPTKKENITDLYDKYILIIKQKVNNDSFISDFIDKMYRNKPNIKITDKEVIELLAQFIIMQPLFDSLYDSYRNNHMTKLMIDMLNRLDVRLEDNDKNTLDKLFNSAKEKSTIYENDKVKNKQEIIKTFLNDFLMEASPKLAKQLGIVFTPIEVIDFILNSVNDILQEEFGVNLTDKNVDILDPFTGAGTFITRLFQNNLIEQEDMERKYDSEIQAQEIVPLSHYISTINIEDTYNNSTNKEKEYKEFNGLRLVDTFQLYED